MADQEPPTTRRDPHFLSRPDPVEAGPATIRETPGPPPLSPIGGAELLAAAGVLSAATQALGGALGSMALVGGAAAIMLAGNLVVLARRVLRQPR
jgi:hypothetical protein